MRVKQRGSATKSYVLDEVLVANSIEKRDPVFRLALMANPDAAKLIAEAMGRKDSLVLAAYQADVERDALSQLPAGKPKVPKVRKPKL